MEKISFNKGYKFYQVNDDENAVIKVNTRDNAIFKRIRTAGNNLKELVEKLKGIENMDSAEIIIDTLAEVDKSAREQIDYIFGKGTSETAFGETDCCSIVDGQPVFMNFIDAIVPLVERDIKTEQARSSKRIEKYTSRVKDDRLPSNKS